MIVGKTCYIITIKTKKSKWKNNVYIIASYVTNQAVVIDPAWEIDLIENELKYYNLNLQAILLTHNHWDHINLVEELHDKYQIPVYIGKQDMISICDDIQAVNNLSKIELGDIKIFVHETPGHTVGSVCYEIENFLFTGDTIFIEGCGICENEINAKLLYKSIQKVKERFNPDTKILPGHTFENELGQELEFLYKNNIYFCIDNVETFINFRMRRGQSNLFDFK